MSFVSLVNVHATNLLKYSAFAFGISYGYTRYQTLTKQQAHHAAKLEQKQYEDLVEEAKIAYETHQSQVLSKLAKADGIKTVDPESFLYNADELANWAVAKFGV